MDAPRGAVGSAAVREPPFELTFRLEPKDYRAFVRKLRWSAMERVMSFLPGLGVGMLGALIGVLAMLARATTVPNVGWLMVAALVGGSILTVLYYLMAVRSFYRSFFDGQPMALGDIKVVADMRGIGTNVAEIVTAMPWSRVMSVVETDQHVFLLFSRLAAVIVPKRAFESAEQGKRFVSFARSMTTASARR